MNFVNKLSTLMNIRPGEGKLVCWVLLYTLLCYTANILVYSTTYALFLHTFNAQSLPYIYIGESIFSTIISLVYLRLSRRYSLAQLLIGNLSLILLSLVGYRVGIALIPARWFIFSLPIWYGVLNTIMFIAFWNLLGRLFTLQQGKRLFGLLNAGQQGATVAVGFLVPGLLVLLATPDLLIVAALAGMGALVVLWQITRSAPGLHTIETEESTATDEAPVVKTKLWSDRYLQLLLAMFALFGLADYFLDNIFYAQLESHLPNPEHLASFLGIFTGLVGSLSLLSHLFLSSWILSRYGIRLVILLTPTLLLLIVTPFALLGMFSTLTVVLFWLATSMNLTRQVTDAFDNTAANLLYQPLPAALRTQMQTMVDGVLYPVAAGVTGLILLWLTNVLHASSVQLAYVLLPILVIWALLALLLGRAYPHRVQQALRQRILQGTLTIQPDHAGLAMIEQNLTNPHPGAVIYALDVLEASNGELLQPRLPGLLQHPSPLVRLDVLARLERLGVTNALPAIRHAFDHEPDAKVRSVALRTLATLGGVEHFDDLSNYLTATEADLRQSVMVGLLRSGELEGMLAAAETLAHLVNAANPAERIFAAQVLGESGMANVYRPLLKLLHDPEPAVQRAAFLAARKVQQPKLWPVLVEALASARTRSMAQSALLEAGEASVPALKGGFLQATALEAHDPSGARQFRIALARTCGRLRSPQTIPLLLDQLGFPDLQVRTQSLLALQQCGYRATAETRPLIEQHILTELAHAAWLLAAKVALAEAPMLNLLHRALDASLLQQRARLFRWLSLLYDAAIMLRVRDVFGAGVGSHRPASEEQRAYALETIDLVVAKPLATGILSLLDDLSPEQRLKRLAPAFPQTIPSLSACLLALITGDEGRVGPWLKAVAFYSAVNTSLPDAAQCALQRAAATVGAAADPILQETAAWVLAMRPTAGQPGPPHLSERLTINSRFAPGESVTRPDLWRVTDSPGAELVFRRLLSVEEGVKPMLLTIEKVMILKTVDIFAHAPDEILVDLAALLKEIETPAGATIFEKGEQGESMYVIVEGEVEALDGERVFTRMGERQIFGEMALLDGEPRTATIRTTQPTRLLRLDQEPFYELMDDRIEIARGVIHVLLQRLRARTDDLNRLRAQVGVT